jgi:hypothetical protein
MPLHQLTRIGLLLLILANFAHYLFSRGVLPASQATDLVLGMLYGLCFGALLLGISRSSRGRPGSECRTL